MKKYFIFILVIFIFNSFFVLPNNALAVANDGEGDIVQVSFTTPPRTTNTNIVSAVLTIQTQNAEGLSKKVGETTTLNFNSSSETGQFSSNSTNWISTNTLTMNSNWANRNFYYRDSTAGIHTLTVTAQGKTWSPAVQIITINKTDQVISFGVLSDKIFGDPDFSISATADSGLPVSFGASGSCTVSETTVHLTGAGTCSVTASQIGDSNFNPAQDVPQSFVVSEIVATPTSTPEPAVSGSRSGGRRHGGGEVLGAFISNVGENLSNEELITKQNELIKLLTEFVRLLEMLRG